MVRVVNNKNGQMLGRKGMETRQRLMDAARQLLEQMSPMDLSAAAITKAASVAAATFYIYFDDISDLLYALSAEAVPEMTDLFEDDTLLRETDRLYSDALAFIEAFNLVWDRHSNILLYRNLEADRGNPRFQELRTQTAIPIMNGLADRIAQTYPDEARPPRHEIYAEAVVIFAAIERLAATTHQDPDQPFRPKQLRQAQARVVARMLMPR